MFLFMLGNEEMNAYAIFAKALSLTSNPTVTELVGYVATLTDGQKNQVLAICDGHGKKFPEDSGAITSVWAALNGSLCIHKPKGLPPLFDDEDDDDDLGESVYVIIKFKGFAFPVVGVYCHKIDGWQFNGDCDTYGTEDVEEWWPMPVIGTGTAPEIKKEGE